MFELPFFPQQASEQASQVDALYFFLVAVSAFFAILIAVLLLCYHYDPTTGKYGAATINAVRVGFVLTVGALLTFVFVSLRRERAANADHGRIDAQIANRI